MWQNPWDTEEERLLAINMGREMMCSEPAPTFASRTAVAACIRNVVGSAAMGCGVNFPEVWRRFPATYQPDFTSLVKRMDNPYNTALISNGGYTVVIGTSSVNATLLSLHYHRLGLIEIGYRPTLRYVSIDNLVVSGSVPFKVEISNYEDDVCDVLWAPYLFPAMIIRFVNPTGTGLLFRGGSFMLVGMSHQRDIDTMYDHFMKILDLHSIDMFDNNSSSASDKQAELSAAQANQGQREIIRRRGGRKRGDAASETGGGGGGKEDVQLLPAQYTECLRRVNARLNKTQARGAEALKVFEEEATKMKRDILQDRRRKAATATGTKATTKDPAANKRPSTSSLPPGRRRRRTEEPVGDT